MTKPTAATLLAEPQPLHAGQKIIIAALSVIVPVVVAILFSVRIPNVAPLDFLPPIYASINALASIALVLALWAIKKRKLIWHIRFIQIAMSLGVLFLVGYIAYHMTSDPTLFGDANRDGLLSPTESQQLGWLRYGYYLLLFSHILLSIGVIPLVLVTYLRGRCGNIQGHRRLAKVTFPLWLYVTVSGVLVYLFISPYY